MKILMARLDRIGDLILSLPMETAWLTQRPDDDVRWLAHKNLKFIFDHSPHLQSSQEKKDIFFTEKAFSLLPRWREFLRLHRWLKSEKFDLVVAVQIPWWAALSFWLARVPHRVGVASQWYSWLFYNLPVRQKRSQAIKNEGDYNLDLIDVALREISREGTEKVSQFVPAKLLANDLKVQEWRSKIGADFIVIHPGMAGSARNWPLKNYKLLATTLKLRGLRVVVTGSVTDQAIVKESGVLDVPSVLNVTERTPPADLLAVLSLARAVVAPSTGVGHLAAALGKKVVGIYSPVRVQAPRRWGPKGAGVRVLVAPVDSCPGELKCLGRACALYDCMEKITVNDVVEALLE